MLACRAPAAHPAPATATASVAPEGLGEGGPDSPRPTGTGAAPAATRSAAPSGPWVYDDEGPAVPATAAGAFAAAKADAVPFVAASRRADGLVREPAGGRFDVTVSPGEDVQAAVRRCPRGGSVLLRPGNHVGPVVLRPGNEVHIFGRGKATLSSASGSVITSSTDVSTIDGVAIRQDAGSRGNGAAVVVQDGRLHVQRCDVTSASGLFNCVTVTGGCPKIVSCRCAPRCC